MHILEKFQIDFINEAINSNALQFGDFTLKSGRKSPYFFNASKLLTNANLRVVIDSFVARLKLSSIAIDQIFGPAYKGTIFGSMLGMKMNEEIKNLSLWQPICYVVLPTLLLSEFKLVVLGLLRQVNEKCFPNLAFVRSSVEH